MILFINLPIVEEKNWNMAGAVLNPNGIELKQKYDPLCRLLLKPKYLLASQLNGIWKYAFVRSMDMRYPVIMPCIFCSDGSLNVLAGR